MCVALDADHLQDTPGTLSTSDGRFRATPMRPIPQIWHDPLSTLSFGDGRTRNLVYVATPLGTTPATPLAPDPDVADVMVFISLMAEGGVEVRLVRGAPQADGGATSTGSPPPLFGVFALDRHDGACAF